jgi:hypothetical protein
MRKTRSEALDALLLRPMLELEELLHARDQRHDHDLGDGAVHLFRHEHDISIHSDECEIILPTDGPVAGSPRDPFDAHPRK